MGGSKIMKNRFMFASLLVSVGMGLGAVMFAPDPTLEQARNTLGGLLPDAALAQENEPEISPTMVRDRPRDTYYPNTEDLAADEMRVIACGTGMPTTRAAQAAVSSLNWAMVTSSSLTSAPVRRNGFPRCRSRTTISTRSSSGTCTRTISVRCMNSSSVAP
jgi:hypothetical protein